MPKGMPLAELPSTASTIINTIAAMELNSTYIQYSWRVALPSNTAYFFNACRYQLIVSSSRLERRAVVGRFSVGFQQNAREKRCQFLVRRRPGKWMWPWTKG